MKTTVPHLASLALFMTLAACAGQGNKGTEPTGQTDGGTTTGAIGGVSAGTTAGGDGGTGSTTASPPVGGTTTGSTTGNTVAQGTIPPTPSGTRDSKSSQVVVAGGTGGSVALPYALLRINKTASNPAKAYTLAISSYSFCGWGIRDLYAGHPSGAKILGLYLQNQSGGTTTAPAPGTYNVAAAGATGMFVDPAISGYSVYDNACAGSFPTIQSGTVTIATFDGTNATGSINLVLAGGLTASGSFTTAVCKGDEADGAGATAVECNW